MQNITKLFTPADFPFFPDANCAVETTTVADAFCFVRDGVSAKHIFLHVDDLPPEEIRAVRGQCRYLVRSSAALFALDKALDGALPTGYLEPVGLCIEPDGFARDIPALSAAMRRTGNLTLRYAFLSLSEDTDLPGAAREAFSFIKRLRADVPCMLHGFCLKGLLEPLSQGDAALCETLEMLAALNDSSLYAEFFIA